MRIKLAVMAGCLMALGCQAERGTEASHESSSAPGDPGVNLIAHGSFEQWPEGEDPHLPIGWRGVEEPENPNITRVSDPARHGASALRIKSGPGVVSIWNDSVPIYATENTELRGRCLLYTSPSPRDS